MAGKTALLLLVLGIVALVPATAKRSRQCPNGCIIASVVHPKRICECVVPQCNQPAEKQQIMMAAAAAAGTTTAQRQDRRPAFQPPRLAGVDCDFCDRDVNTFSRCGSRHCSVDGKRPPRVPTCSGPCWCSGNLEDQQQIARFSTVPLSVLTSYWIMYS